MQYHRLGGIFLASLLLIGCGSEEPVVSDTPSQPMPAADESAVVADSGIPEYPIEDFMNSVSYTGASFSPDGSKILVSHNLSGIFNVYAINTDGSGEEQLTFSGDNATLAVAYFPEDERFIYTADQGGNELTHVYVRELDGMEVDLTPGENLKAGFAGWADDYQSFFVQSNERDPRFFSTA